MLEADEQGGVAGTKAVRLKPHECRDGLFVRPYRMSVKGTFLSFPLERVVVRNAAEFSHCGTERLTRSRVFF